MSSGAFCLGCYSLFWIPSNYIIWLQKNGLDGTLFLNNGMQCYIYGDRVMCLQTGKTMGFRGKHIIRLDGGNLYFDT